MKIVWFCAAGYSFFLGVGILIFAIILSMYHKKLWSNILISTLTIIGVFLIFLSAAPLQLWFYIIWVVVVLAWLLFAHTSIMLKYRRFICITALCLSIIALLLELPFQLKPSLPKGNFDKLYIIGDSVSAGIGGREEQTWPKIIRRKYSIDVIDLSQPGATVTSAKQQANKVDSENAIVLLEIGGNNLFAPTPTYLFEQDLRRILKTVSDPKRTVVMLELPLQPWHIKYGRIQRRLAEQFDVILIPRRFFVSVLSVEGATVDLAHLSPSGHELMAEKIWSFLESSISPVSQESQN